MEFLLDTANIDEIQKYTEMLPISGVTSNPSIVKKEGKVDFFQHMKRIREIIGIDKTLHVQVVAEDVEGILADAHTILEKIDREVYVKIPVTENGLQAMKQLKKEGVNITATAVYTKFQAYLAIAAGANYVAPYFNRMENQNMNPVDLITEVAKEIERTSAQTKILAASFKNVGQVNTALEAGAQASTMSVDILQQALGMPSIQQAVDVFTQDWESIFGEGTTITLLK
ncbi:MAG: fructose-6-phosphate aldolase [Lactobacillales bacterium]|jgi:TalC/MipB family fructose-6-phosphate aldolase|nr:fructose-6-phosphate aldolase [Lactobacillales bacterium]